MQIEKKLFIKRRQELMAQMEPDSIAVLSAARPRLRNGDADYTYRQNSDFYYLTGFAEPEAILVLVPGREQGESILFCQEKDELKELWNGKLLGPEAAIDTLGMDDSFPIDDVDDILPGLIEGRERVYSPMGKDEQFDHQLMEWVRVIRSKVRSGAHPPGEFLVLDHILHEMRLIKSKAELSLMKKSAQIAVAAHKRAMHACRPGMQEYELEAEYLYEFARSGCLAPAYSSIVAGGPNACILHYTTNDQPLNDGELVLIDAGCEYEYYASDITRTFPVNGKFTAEQKALYDIVLDAQLEAIKVIKPGAHWDDAHNRTVEVITEGLLELGLLKGKLKDLIAEGAYKDFYMHRAGHWLGMDVHDVGDYKIEGKWRLLEPGMVMTVEPGIYVSERNSSVAEKWRGIGIRIEDDVAVSKKGNEVLTKGLPKTTAEIESFMAA
ncbi:MAG: Xaa-Pro aminopeptidase [Gammaproteobacteria bacterium]|nr:Xaa-Pro aminopeptidase [Gammaproteobacteria bacterium]|tara:strand:+ start:46881 stop:48194 length:1314 start_codon:yes stop_codon:yes gene_type:complete